MANTIGKVRAVFTASTSGLMSAVSQASSAFRRLGGDASALTAAMGRLEGISTGGIATIPGPAQAATLQLQKFRTEAEALNAALAAGTMGPQQFAESMASLTTAATSAAAQLSAFDEQFKRGAAIATETATAEERYAAKVRDLDGLLKVGAISQQTYGRAVAAAKDELTKSQAGANAFASGAKKVEVSIAGVTSRLNAMIAIQGAQLFSSLISSASSAASSLVSMGKASADTISKTGALAERIGTTYAEFQGLSLAAEMAGVSTDAIGAAVERTGVMFANAAGGSKKAQQAFASIGLSLESLNGMTAADRFQAISDAIASLPTPAERAAAAVRMFGSSGAELVPLFNQGAGSIQKMTEQADRLGLALTDAEANNVRGMTDAFTMAQKAVQGVIDKVVAYLSPAITNVATAFTNMIGSVGGSNIGQFIGEGILSAARYFAGIVDYFVAQVPNVWKFVSQVGAQWGTVWEAGKRFGSYLAYVGRAYEAVFKGVGSLLVGGVGRILNAVGELTQAIPGWGQIGKQIEASGESMMKTSTKLWNEAGTAAEAAAQNLSDVFTGSEASEAGEAMATPVTDAIDNAIAAARNAANEVSQAKPQNVDIKQKVEVEAKALKQAVTGIESRSSEGIKEMFRIMRGDTGNDVAEKQLDELRGIRDGIDNLDQGLGIDTYDLAPAAGG